MDTDVLPGIESERNDEMVSANASEESTIPLGLPARGDVLPRRRETDRDGRTTTHVFDLEGRMTRSTMSDGSSRTWVFDAAGRLSAFTDALGGVSQYVHDAAGRRTAFIDSLDKTGSPAQRVCPGMERYTEDWCRDQSRMGLLVIPDSDKILEEIDRMSETHPDPAWMSAEVKELVFSLHPDEGDWPFLIQRYGKSRSFAVLEGLAACLAEEVRRPESTASADTIFLLIKRLSVHNPNLIHACLAALENCLRYGDDTIRFEQRADELFDFLVLCFDNPDTQAFIVRIAVLSLLETVVAAGILHDIFDEVRIKLLQEKLMTTRDALDDIFAEQATDLLNVLRGGRGG